MTEFLLRRMARQLDHGFGDRRNRAVLDPHSSVNAEGPSGISPHHLMGLFLGRKGASRSCSIPASRSEIFIPNPFAIVSTVPSVWVYSPFSTPPI